MRMGSVIVAQRRHKAGRIVCDRLSDRIALYALSSFTTGFLGPVAVALRSTGLAMR